MSKESVKLELPDGRVLDMAPGSTGYDAAKMISEGLARNALSVTVNGNVYDLHRILPESGNFSVNTWDSTDGKATFWHSTAHVMAEAVQSLYPNAKFGIGPAIENGFYYDIDFGDVKVGPDEQVAIENKMVELLKNKSNYTRTEIAKDEAITYFKQKQDPYKLDLLEGLEDGTISFYNQGDFTDLCRGPHLPSTEPIKAVKLMNIAGAYWRGDASGKQLTRLYGISFPKKSMLDEYLNQLEEAKKRDHKKLGKQLGIYMIDPMVGQGLPVWLPKGTVMRRTLEAFLRDEQVSRGYKEVITPHIGNLDLYRTSGHYPYYADSQYDPIKVDDEEYLLKPMNCPHHHRIYANEMRSYRDLPLRLSEFGTVYRYEQSGELNGLSRVRGFTQDDAHIYCMHSQLKQELKNTIDLTQYVFRTFDMPVDIRLSFRDDNADKYGGDLSYWERAEREIREVAEELGLAYTIAPGEASFYGPKIDFIIRDAIGRKWQLGTVQVDYVMPERFDLTYVGNDNQKHRPVIIHRAPFGSMERFTSILIEHFAGNFPLWLAPVQAVVLSMNDNCVAQAQEYANSLLDQGIRAEVDIRNEQIGAKIREAEHQKVPYMLVLGDKERAEGTVNVRRHKKGQVGNVVFSELISSLLQEINTRQLPD